MAWKIFQQKLNYTEYIFSTNVWNGFADRLGNTKTFPTKGHEFDLLTCKPFYVYFISYNIKPFGFIDLGFLKIVKLEAVL
jgi:hypothetical protein